MKQLLFLIVLLQLALSGQAQPPARRIYRDRGEVVIADSLGNNPVRFPASQVVIQPSTTNVMVVAGGVMNLYPASRFLSKSGTAYNAFSASTAYSAYQASVIDANGYSQSEVNLMIANCYVRVNVSTKAQAIAAAAGSQPKIIKVLIDDSDGNRPNNRYIYEGDNQPLGLPLF